MALEKAVGAGVEVSVEATEGATETGGTANARSAARKAGAVPGLEVREGTPAAVITLPTRRTQASAPIPTIARG